MVLCGQVSWECVLRACVLGVSCGQVCVPGLPARRQPFYPRPVRALAFPSALLFPLHFPRLLPCRRSYFCWKSLDQASEAGLLEALQDLVRVAGGGRRHLMGKQLAGSWAEPLDGCFAGELWRKARGWKQEGGN
jgi:hypothetical protein